MSLNSISHYRFRLKNELEYYACNCLNIRTKSGTIERLNFNKAQKYLHKTIEAQKASTGRVRCLILKGRQQGCSTYVSSRYYHHTTHNVGIRTFILTHEQEATNNLFDMVDRFHNLNLPQVKPTTGASNRKELIFDGIDSGYRIGTAGTKGVGRSSTIQLLHGSEVAFWPFAKEHAAGILQAVPNEAGTEIILESTANGFGNLFHSKWQEAEIPDNEYIGIFIPWFWQDEYRLPIPKKFKLTEEESKYQNLHGLDLNQMVWRRKKITELGDSLLFKQEYPATPSEAFQTTGIDSFINSDDVLQARRHKIDKPYGAVLAGFDSARDGDDRDAFIYRQGPIAYGLEYNNFKTFPQKVAFCLKKLQNDKPWIDMLYIDYGGGGWEIAEMLREAGKGDRIRVVNFGAKALNDEAYHNKRAEMYGGLKRWLTNEDEPVSLPNSDALHSDITAPSYFYDSKTRIQLERKAEIKKRSLRSPDGADALALTFSFPYKKKSIKNTKPLPVKSFF